MKPILIVIGILVGLGVAIFVGLHIYVYVALWITGIGLRKRLSMADRTLSLSEAKALIAKESGTIFVDAPTLGWNVSRVWWAPEGTVIAGRPESWGEERMCPDEDHMNYDGLISPAQGVAKLVCPFVFTQRIQPLLRRHFGIEKCPFIFTGGVEFERISEQRKVDQAGGREPPSRPESNTV